MYASNCEGSMVTFQEAHQYTHIYLIYSQTYPMYSGPSTSIHNVVSEANNIDKGQTT